MSAALKDHFSPAFVRDMGAALHGGSPGLDPHAFSAQVLAGWKTLELKQRMRRASTLLGEHLPGPYPRQLQALFAVEASFHGLAHLVFPDFVQVHGLAHWDESMDALARFTSGSSSEFAIRPFLEMDLERGMRQMRAWSRDGSPHVRRLASEGCRPRLPWAPPLRALRQDPAPALPILDALRDDPSEYVRRSVANHLNDICKDHPEIAKAWAREHLGASARTDRLIKHGLRTLIKNADPAALALLGYTPVDSLEVAPLHLSRKTVDAQSPLRFSTRIQRADGRHLGLLRVDVLLHYRKANGTLSPKVFHLLDRDVAQAAIDVEGSRAFHDLSTRVHHAGEHAIELRVNGLPMARATFRLHR